MDSGATSSQAIHRELLEKLGLDVNPSDFQQISIADSEIIKSTKSRSFWSKWMDKEEIVARIKNNCEAEKTGKPILLDNYFRKNS